MPEPNSRRPDYLHALPGVGRYIPHIEKPGFIASSIPIAGPLWEAAADLQDGDIGGAAFNGIMAITDALPVGVAFKGARMATKGVGILKEGSTTARAAQQLMRKRLDLKGKPYEIHHSVPLAGIKRGEKNWRNHNAFLKVLPTEQHRRLTGSWGGKPKYDPIRQVWYGTTDWQKAIPTALAARASDTAENLRQQTRERRTAAR